MKARIAIAAAVFLLIGFFSFRMFNISLFKAPGPTEQEIAQLLENPESIPEITWKTLYEFDYKTGKGPKKLMDLDGKLVKIAGYIVPLSDDYTKLDEFILVPDGQACIHVPPPPPNLIVTVSMRKSVPPDEVSNPAWLKGIFRIDHSESEFGGSSYKVDGLVLEEYVW